MNEKYREAFIQSSKTEAKQNIIAKFITYPKHTVKVDEASYSSTSIMEYDANNKAAMAYVAFAREVIGHAEYSR